MTPDTRKSYFLSIGIFCALLITFLVPSMGSSRIIAAVLLLPSMVITLLLLRKKGILSINKGTVTLIMVVSAFLYLMLVYLLGIYFGYYKYLGFSLGSLLKFIIPITIIIISSEIIRRSLLSQEKKITSRFAYLIPLLAELVRVSNFWQIDIFSEFMEMVGMTLLPAIVSGVLYQYLSKNYGAISVIPYRLITTLYPYVIARISNTPDAILALINILTPILLYLFIKSLFEKKPQ